MKTIITHPNFAYLGKKLAKKSGFQMAEINFKSFPDGWPAYFIENVVKNISDREIVYIGDFSKPEQLFENYSILRGILEYGAKTVDVYMPYFPVAQMERVSMVGEIAIAKYYADIFSLLPFGTSGKTNIHIFDIHALSVRFFFDDFKVNVELHSSMKLIKKEITKKTVIVFPDEGADKRFAPYFEGYDKIICSKVRKADAREIVIKEGNAKGKDVVIIDDLIQSGGTIIEAVKLLRRVGAKKVDAFATHGVFPNNSHIKTAQSLDTLYLTDSIPENDTRKKDVKNIKILEIFNLIEKQI